VTAALPAQVVRSPSDVDRTLAAEFVLGTLDPDERKIARGRVGADPQFATLVRQWERRLAPLHELAVPVAPPPQLWRQILADLDAARAARPSGGRARSGAPVADASGRPAPRPDLKGRPDRPATGVLGRFRRLLALPFRRRAAARPARPETPERRARPEGGAAAPLSAPVARGPQERTLGRAIRAATDAGLLPPPARAPAPPEPARRAEPQRPALPVAAAAGPPPAPPRVRPPPEPLAPPPAFMFLEPEGPPAAGPPASEPAHGPAASPPGENLPPAETLAAGAPAASPPLASPPAASPPGATAVAATLALLRAPPSPPQPPAAEEEAGAEAAAAVGQDAPPAADTDIGLTLPDTGDADGVSGPVSDAAAAPSEAPEGGDRPVEPATAAAFEGPAETPLAAPSPADPAPPEAGPEAILPDAAPPAEQPPSGADPDDEPLASDGSGAEAQPLPSWAEAVASGSVSALPEPEDGGPAAAFLTGQSDLAGEAQSRPLDPAATARQVLRWQVAAALLLVLCLGLGAGVAYRTWFWPDDGQWVGVLRATQTQPAIALRIDPVSGAFHVRAFAPEPPPGQTYRLWLVTETRGTLLLGAFTTMLSERAPALARMGAGGLRASEVLVTREPAARALLPGSGPGEDVVYRGRLMPD